MAWNTPIVAASLTLDETVAAPNYDPAVILNDTAHPLHREWLMKRDALLTEWENAKGVLERAKESEMEARKAVQAFAFGKTAKVGMNNQPLAGGYELKFGRKVNHKISAENDAIDKAEDKAAEIGNRGTFLFERIIMWKPDFSLTEYKKLDVSDPTDKAVKELVDTLIEVTDGTGSLEIKAPKAKLNG